MMSFQKVLLAAMALCMMAGMALADPMRTVFTMENNFPDAMGWEVSLGGGATTYERDRPADDINSYFIGPEARFGVTDRLALNAAIPLAGYDDGDDDNFGFGDMSLGMEFLFFEDIFEYAWVIPHADVVFPTGDEDKGLGWGKTQLEAGISIGTTVNDVVHFAADASYTANGKIDEDGDYDHLVTGALSIVWDLDARASLLGEVQIRDDTADEEDDYGLMGHGGLAYKVNENVSLMVYGGGASDLLVDYYGMGRIVYSF